MYLFVCLGVIFALKIITTDNSSGSSVIMGIRVPTKYAAWAELIAIHILVPNASFLGHLAGIIAGVLYVKTPLKRIIDGVCTTITGIAALFYCLINYINRKAIDIPFSFFRSSNLSSLL